MNGYPAARVIYLLQQACNSLAEAHSIGLIHRDLKPENLMVCSRGGLADTLKVLDFGLARVTSNDPERDQISAALCGTPNYMPPEAITAPQTVDGRSDLYSLGAVGYFLLTGQTIFSAATIPAVLQCHLSEAPTRPSDRIGLPIDEDLEGVVLRCLSKTQQERPATADELSQMLARCKSAGTWNPRLAPPPSGGAASQTPVDSQPRGLAPGLDATFIAG